jgi:hypothetical protein
MGIGMLILGACSGGLDIAEMRGASDALPEGKGRFVLRVADRGSRTAIPTFENVTKYKAVFTRTDDLVETFPIGNQATAAEGITQASLILEEGTWDVIVYAYVSSRVSGTAIETEIGSGSAKGIAIVAAKENSAVITIDTIASDAEGAKGTLRWLVTYPQGTYSGLVTLLHGDGTSLAGFADVDLPSGNRSDSYELDPGVYLFKVAVFNAAVGYNKRAAFIRTIEAHVYAGLTTRVTYEAPESELVFEIPVKGTVFLTESLSLTVTDRRISLYAADGTLLESTGNLANGSSGTDTPFCFFVPSAYAGSDVFVVPQIQVVEEQWIDGNKTLIKAIQPEAQVLDSLTSSFYKIETAIFGSGIITAQVAAASTDSVNFKLEPSSGYKISYLSVTSDNNPVNSDSADGNYTFTMPNGDVTIKAEFVQATGITIEGPQDETINVTVINRKADDPDSMEISFTANETLTFTVDDSAYTVDGGTLRWFIDGAEIILGNENDPASVNGSSLIISADSYNPRVYSLLVMVKAANGLWYSADKSFTVTE